MTKIPKLGLSRFLQLSLIALGIAACASTPLLQSDLAALDISNPNLVGSKVLSGGQPSAADLARLKEKGFGTIINLRTESEDMGFDEATEAETLGLNYVSIPISTGDGLTVENATKLRMVLGQSKAPVLVHCGSGNRVGALFAIGAYLIDEKSLESAISEGRAAGLTRLEPKVRDILAQSETGR